MSTARTIRVLPQSRALRIIDASGTRLVKVQSRALRIVEVGRVVINTTGGGSEDAELSLAEAIFPGMALRVDAALTQFRKARADNYATSMVLGLAESGASAGFSVIAKRQRLILSDWTAATGATELSTGSYYYLSADTAGALTQTPPTAPGHVVCCVGQALNPTTLLINISDPILL